MKPTLGGASEARQCLLIYQMFTELTLFFAARLMILAVTIAVAIMVTVIVVAVVTTTIVTAVFVCVLTVVVTIKVSAAAMAATLIATAIVTFVMARMAGTITIVVIVTITMATTAVIITSASTIILFETFLESQILRAAFVIGNVPTTVLAAKQIPMIVLRSGAQLIQELVVKFARKPGSRIFFWFR